MTKGYIIIIDNKKNIIDSVYSYSDSYLSGLGMNVLEAFSENKVFELIKDLQKEDSNYEYKINKISWYWIEKTTENQDEFFADYAYVYNKDKNLLSVYHYGKFAFSVKFEDIEVAKYLFENKNELYYKMSFDKKTMQIDKDIHKFIRTAFRKKLTVYDLERIKDSKINSFHMCSGKIFVNYRDKTDFLKEIQDIDTGRVFKFIVKYKSNKREIYLETVIGDIFTNIIVGTDLAAERAIKKLQVEKRDEIINLLPIFDYINDYKFLLSSYTFNNEDYDTVNEKSKKELSKTLNKIASYRDNNMVYQKNSSNLSNENLRIYLDSFHQKMLKSKKNIEQEVSL